MNPITQRLLKLRASGPAVAISDAVTELSVTTGDEGLDFLHSILIDLLQRGFIDAVRRKDGELGYIATKSGRKYVREQLGSLNGP